MSSNPAPTPIGTEVEESHLDPGLPDWGKELMLWLLNWSIKDERHFEATDREVARNSQAHAGLYIINKALEKRRVERAAAQAVAHDKSGEPRMLAASLRSLQMGSENRSLAEDRLPYIVHCQRILGKDIDATYHEQILGFCEALKEDLAAEAIVIELETFADAFKEVKEELGEDWVLDWVVYKKLRDAKFCDLIGHH